MKRKLKPIWDYETGGPLPSRNKSSELTWQDVEQLVLLTDTVAREMWFINGRHPGGQELYKEVLRRFNERKK